MIKRTPSDSSGKKNRDVTDDSRDFQRDRFIRVTSPVRAATLGVKVTKSGGIQYSSERRRPRRAFSPLSCNCRWREWILLLLVVGAALIHAITRILSAQPVFANTNSVPRPKGEKKKRGRERNSLLFRLNCPRI